MALHVLAHQVFSWTPQLYYYLVHHSCISALRCPTFELYNMLLYTNPCNTGSSRFQRHVRNLPILACLHCVESRSLRNSFPRIAYLSLYMSQSVLSGQHHSQTATHSSRSNTMIQPLSASLTIHVVPIWYKRRSCRPNITKSYSTSAHRPVRH